MHIHAHAKHAYTHTRQLVEEFKPQEIGNTLWALATLRLHPPHVCARARTQTNHTHTGMQFSMYARERAQQDASSLPLSQTRRVCLCLSCRLSKALGVCRLCTPIHSHKDKVLYRKDKNLYRVPCALLSLSSSTRHVCVCVCVRHDTC